MSLKKMTKNNQNDACDPIAQKTEKEIDQWLLDLIRQASLEQKNFFKTTYLRETIELPDEVSDQLLAANTGLVYLDYYQEVAKSVSESVFQNFPYLESSEPLCVHPDGKEVLTAGNLYACFYKKLLKAEAPADPVLMKELDTMQRQILLDGIREILEEVKSNSPS